MSHIICVKCGSNDHFSQYGLQGARTWCEGCNTLIEWVPDDKESAGRPKKAQAMLNKALRKWKKRTYRGQPISKFYTPPSPEKPHDP